jgi:hypothetical protein
MGTKEHRNVNTSLFMGTWERIRIGGSLPFEECPRVLLFGEILQSTPRNKQECRVVYV